MHAGAKYRPDATPAQHVLHIRNAPHAPEADVAVYRFGKVDGGQHVAAQRAIWPKRKNVQRSRNTLIIVGISNLMLVRMCVIAVVFRG